MKCSFVRGDVPYLATLPSCLLYVRPTGVADGGISFADWSGKKRVLTRAGVLACNSVACYKFSPCSISIPTANKGNYISIPASSDLALGPGDFTFRAVVNLLAVGNANGIFSGQTNYTSSISVYINNTDIRGYFGTVASSTSGFTPAAGMWYDIVFIRKSGNLKIYVNGTQFYSGTNNGSIAADANGYWIGQRQSTLNYNLNGYIDEIGLWNIALSISDFYNASAPQALPQFRRLIE